MSNMTQFGAELKIGGQESAIDAESKVAALKQAVLELATSYDQGEIGQAEFSTALKELNAQLRANAQAASILATAQREQAQEAARSAAAAAAAALCVTLLIANAVITLGYAISGPQSTRRVFPVLRDLARRCGGGSHRLLIAPPATLAPATAAPALLLALLLLPVGFDGLRRLLDDLFVLVLVLDVGRLSQWSGWQD